MSTAKEIVNYVNFKYIQNGTIMEVTLNAIQSLREPRNTFEAIKNIEEAICTFSTIENSKLNSKIKIVRVLHLKKL